MPDIDLYRTFSPLKEYFSMASRRLVAYEKLIGLEREDVFNGGELVDVYKEFVGKSKFDKAAAEELKKSLLLHNEEDIKDMIPVMSLLTYIDLFNGNYKELEITEDGPRTGEEDLAERFITLNLTMHSDFAIGSSHTVAMLPGVPPVEVSVSGSAAVIRIPVVTGTYRHFFDDYKNYYYLPGEDTAIHKSIASAVESAHREQATKTTAYTKASGEFVPQRREIVKPAFKKDASDKISFAPLTKFKAANADLKSYVRSLF